MNRVMKDGLTLNNWRKNHMLFIALLSLILPMAFTYAQEENETKEPYYEPPDDPRMPEYIWSVAWSPDGSHIAMGKGPEVCNQNNNDYSVRILSAATGEIITNLEYHNCSVTSIDWNPDSSQLLTTAGIEGEAHVWNISTGERVSYYYSPSMPGFIDNVWNPSYNRIASISEVTRPISIWNPTNGDSISSFDAGFPQAITWSPDGTQLAAGGAGGAGGAVKIWNASTGQLITELLGQTHTVTSIAWSPDGSKIASAEVVTIQIWNATTGASLLTLQGHTDRINQIVWSPDSTRLASASYDETVRIWDTTTGTGLAVIQYAGPVMALDWSPDGSQLVFGGITNDGQDAQLEIVEAPQLLDHDTSNPSPVTAVPDQC